MANSSFFKNTGTTTQLQTSASASAAAALASEQAALASQTAAATSETNAAASAAASATSASQSLASSNNSAASESNAATSEANALAASTSASSDAASASADATQTAADRVQTGLDRVATSADAVQTAADRVQTGLDVTSSSASAAAALSSRNAAATSETNAAASAASSSADATATAADRVQTGLDAASTTADALATAADRVQTGLDATASANSASAASTSATSASNSQIAAASSAAAAAATLDTFDDRYLGSYASDPTVDNDGNALVTGALYFSSTANEMRVYDGGNWIAASSAGGASLLNYNFTATASQTAFSGADDNSNTLSYTVDNLIVTRNGVVLEDGTDYTATDGSTITLAVAAAAGDEINVVAFKSFTTADMVSATNGGTFQGNVDFAAGLDVTGNVTVTGTVDGRDVATDGIKLDGIEALADVTDATNVAAAGALMTTGGSVTGDVSFGDNDKAIFGTSNDLQIWHDSTAGASKIYDAGAGNLELISNGAGVRFSNPADEETFNVVNSGATTIYHNRNAKLSTTATGVDVTGGLTTTGNALIRAATGSGTLNIVSSANVSNAGNKIAFFGANRFEADEEMAFIQPLLVGNNGGAGNVQSGHLTFGTSGTERLRIHSSGEVLIGTGVDHSSQLTLGNNGGSKLVISGNGNIGSEVNKLEFRDRHNATYPEGQLGSYIYGHRDGAGVAHYLTFGTTDVDADAVERMRIDSSGNVGIGTSSPQAGWKLHVNGAIQAENESFSAGRENASKPSFNFHDDTDTGIFNINPNILGFSTSGSERMRIDSSGNVLVGKTSLTNSVAGIELNNTGQLVATFSGGTHVLGRNSTDGSILQFNKDASNVGSISARSSALCVDYSSRAGLSGTTGYDAILPGDGSGGLVDNVIDLGISNVRFDNIYATNGTIQTSDANEKQQIAALTDAEITAAKSISQLFKTFKWNSAVEAKGDAARTHTGVIAQDVQAAMTAAGLDAGDYAFFISGTWYVDADGNEVEADAEGAIENNRKGIRYPELLAFVGAATEQRLANIETRLAALETA